MPKLLSDNVHFSRALGNLGKRVTLNFFLYKKFTERPGDVLKFKTEVFF